MRAHPEPTSPALPGGTDPPRPAAPDGHGTQRDGSWRAQLRSWWVPTPAELVGLALLLLGALVASVLWWYPSVTGPGGARASEGAPDAATVGHDVGAERLLDPPEAGGPQPPAPGEGAGPAGRVTVHVTGAVLTAGLLTLPAEARVGDAVAAAGGATVDADLERINLARLLVDGEHVQVPRLGEELPAVPMDQGPSAVGADGLLDLNRASEAELETLPGIGPSRAAAIVDHRDLQGPFAVPGDLREVPGIGEATFQTLAPLVVVR